MEQYPVLRDPQYGYKWINIDFNSLFETDESNFFAKWPENYKKLLKATDDKNPTEKITHFKSVLAKETVSQRKYHPHINISIDLL